MAANTVLVSRFPLLPNAGKLLAAGLVDDAHTRNLFDLEQQELLQLRSYDSVAGFAAGNDVLNADLERFASHMIADVKRELLTYVEAPKPCASPLPTTDYVQLRHVEVPPARQAAYRNWREQTRRQYRTCAKRTAGAGASRSPWRSGCRRAARCASASTRTIAPPCSSWRASSWCPTACTPS